MQSTDMSNLQMDGVRPLVSLPLTSSVYYYVVTKRALQECGLWGVIVYNWNADQITKLTIFGKTQKVIWWSGDEKGLYYNKHWVFKSNNTFTPAQEDLMAKIQLMAFSW